MNIDDGKKSRAALKSYFVKNAIPTEQQFAQLMDSVLNQRDDGLVKPPGDPLSIEAVGDDTSFKKALNFYTHLSDTDPAWTVSLRPRANPADPQTGRTGLSINDAAGNSRLTIDAATGHVGIGVTSPMSSLHVAGDAGVLNVEGKTHAYIQLYPKGFAAGRSAWLGFGDPNAPTAFTMQNDAGRMHISGAELLYILNKDGVIIGKEWGGNGNLTVEGNLTVGNLAVGPWPANGQYVFFGASTLNQAQQGNYALLQSASGGDSGQTYLNSPHAIHFRIGNGERMTLTPEALTVNGPLKTQSTQIVNIGHPSPNGKYGTDAIRGEPNLWLDAAGKVIIKQGYTAEGLDIAERFPAGESLSAGDVIIFDETDRRIHRCDRAADRRAVGIVSAEAAFILGTDDTEVPVALCGRVPCKVDADIAPVIAGDLLTTSPTPGHAQKADDPANCAGAIIGKALTSLAGGRGEVLVLVHGR